MCVERKINVHFMRDQTGHLRPVAALTSVFWKLCQPKGRTFEIVSQLLAG
jgi:hypothetical protein